jgi:outer membrane protein OmpA-like peptidoglycan-associated protein
MKLRLIYITIFLISMSTCLHAQKDNVAKANAKYKGLSFVESIQIYENLVKDGYGSSQVFENLGNAYYYQSNYESAKSNYDSLFKKTQNVSVNTYYKYISVLRSQEQYKQADIWHAKMLEMYPNEAQEKSPENTLFVRSNIVSVESVAIKNSSINSKYSDYKVSYLGENQVVYTSSRETSKLFSKKSTWNNEAYTNLYKSQLITKDSLGTALKLKGSINKYYNESSAVFTKDGLTMYFTRNNYKSGKVASDSINNVLLKIYKATFNGKRWSKIEELPFNSNQYSCGHPALSPNEDYLYFSSDMPGTLGASDLFRVSISNNDAYGTPENLGTSINTKGRDTFPFITSENILVFASDFRSGLGGLDLYYVALNSTKKRVYTFSAPINSPNDDFGLVYKVTDGSGFLTSNRKEGSLGSDDIYQINRLLLPKNIELTLVFKSDKEQLLIGTTTVMLTGDGNNSLGPVTAIDQKITLFDLEATKSYQLAVRNDNYELLETSIKYQGKDTLVVKLTEKAPPPAPLDLREILNLETIYFDFDKTKITQQSAKELKKVLTIMNQYPSIHIEIVGHTDRIGPKSYNMQLSLRRAELTKKWLVENGISSERMATKGMGDSKPINDCIGTKKCIEQQHIQNRRTEFIIKLI